MKYMQILLSLLFLLTSLSCESKETLQKKYIEDLKSNKEIPLTELEKIKKIKELEDKVKYADKIRKELDPYAKRFTMPITSKADFGIYWDDYGKQFLNHIKGYRKIMADSPDYERRKELVAKYDNMVGKWQLIIDGKVPIDEDLTRLTRDALNSMGDEYKEFVPPVDTAKKESEYIRVIEETDEIVPELPTRYQYEEWLNKKKFWKKVEANKKKLKKESSSNVFDEVIAEAESAERNVMAKQASDANTFIDDISCDG